MKKIKLAALAATAVLTLGCMTVPAAEAETEEHVHSEVEATGLNYSPYCPKCKTVIGSLVTEEHLPGGLIHVFRVCSKCGSLYDYYA